MVIVDELAKMAHFIPCIGLPNAESTHNCLYKLCFIYIVYLITWFLIVVVNLLPNSERRSLKIWVCRYVCSIYHPSIPPLSPISAASNLDEVANILDSWLYQDCLQYFIHWKGPEKWSWEDTSEVHVQYLV